MTRRAAHYEVVEFHVALLQRNIKKLEYALYDVSDPKSENYGKHWTKSQILDLVAPDQKVSQQVVEFLEKNHAFDIVNERDYVVARARVEDIEKMFDIDLFHFEHTSTPGRTIVRSAQSIDVPYELLDIVHMITGLYELPTLILSEATEFVEASPVLDNGLVIPQSIQRIYNIPSEFPTNANSSVAFAEIMGYYSYLANDLPIFSQQTQSPAITVTHIVNTQLNTSNPDFGSTVDVEFGGSLSQGAQVWYWSTENWIYENAVQVFTADPAPLILSQKQGFAEADICYTFANCTNFEFIVPVYVDRVNTEYMKLGLRGVTVIVAAGDGGSLGNTINPNCWANKTLSPFFPATSPYATVVGATMLVQDDTVAVDGALPPICSYNQGGIKGCSTSNTELTATYPETTFTSSGNFGSYSEMPAYQADAVNAYLDSGVQLPTAYFNRSNRAYPDVVAVGNNFGIIASGQVQTISGTSCATPTFAGIVSLLNSYRLNNNKSPLGFINPLLYQAPSTAFNDITTGNNGCNAHCCLEEFGFEATSGWDAVSGLGSVNFKNLLAHISTLN
eukprot:gene12307-14434_t